jgi:hypothetical protein
MKFEGMLSEERLNEIRTHKKPDAAMVKELFGHNSALEVKHDCLLQYYEEFVIPEIQRGGWVTAEDQRRDFAARNERLGP